MASRLPSQLRCRSRTALSRISAPFSLSPARPSLMALPQRSRVKASSFLTAARSSLPFASVSRNSSRVCASLYRFSPSSILASSASISSLSRISRIFLTKTASLLARKRKSWARISFWLFTETTALRSFFIVCKAFISTNIRLSIIKKIRPTTKPILTIILVSLRIIPICMFAGRYTSPAGGHPPVRPPEQAFLTALISLNGALISAKMQDVSGQFPCLGVREPAASGQPIIGLRPDARPFFLEILTPFRTSSIVTLNNSCRKSKGGMISCAFTLPAFDLNRRGDHHA